MAGRAGAVTLADRPACDQPPRRKARVRQRVFGMHGAHGEFYAASLADIISLARNRPTPGPCAVLGDTNADQRTARFRPRPERDDGPHVAAKEHMEAAAAALDLRINLPDLIRSGIGGIQDLASRHAVALRSSHAKAGRADSGAHRALLEGRVQGGCRGRERLGGSGRKWPWRRTLCHRRARHYRVGTGRPTRRDWWRTPRRRSWMGELDCKIRRVQARFVVPRGRAALDDPLLVRASPCGAPLGANLLRLARR